jgi:two-component system, OmpR family, sensor histidine kinase SenX3
VRRLPLVVSLLIGSAVLLWGLGQLQGIFIEERDDALNAIAARRRALEQFAHKELEQRLAARLSSARRGIDAAAADPLVAASDVWLVDRGEQVLPRTARSKSGTGTPARMLYETLVGPTSGAHFQRVEEQDPDGPWTERLRLFEELKAALSAGDRAQTEVLVRTILSQRAAYVISTTRDIPFTTAMLAVLQRGARPTRSLMESLLRDGLQGRVSRLEGLQRVLLRKRDRFNTPEVAFLRDRIVELCEPQNVLYADFTARVNEPPGQLLALPDSLTEPMLLYDGQWYVEPARNLRVYGVQVAIPAVLDEITSTMRERSLLGASDEVRGMPGAATVSLSALAVTIDSPQWQPTIDAVHSRYRLKAALEIAIALLVFGVMGLGAWIYRRRHRFLELKSGFVSAVSHELRTPLASIRLMTETLERRTKDNPRVKDYPARIIRDVDSLSLLVENILSFDRLSKGRWTPKPEPLTLRGIVDRLELEKDLWARRPAELSAANVDDVELVVDPDLTQLLFTNLARNATQYCERSPASIHIESARGGRQEGVVIRIRDNGIGMPQSERDTVFDDFYRAGFSKKMGERGSGLGLSICRKIMEAHGGSIRVAATSEEGTTFELTFPASAVGS